MKVIVLYDGNEESAKKCDLEEFCLTHGHQIECGDIGQYDD